MFGAFAVVLQLLLFAAWGFLWWRLRGGAFTALTGCDPGTGGMRAIAALAMAAPLALIAWWALLLVPALWVGWAITGWAPFQDMGDNHGTEKRSFPVSNVLDLLRVSPDNEFHDVIGMSLCGVICLAPAGLVFACLGGTWLFPTLGLAFGPLYAVAREIALPDWGRFARAHSEWGECFTGAFVQPMLLLGIATCSL
jgi:hypothetical protein